MTARESLGLQPLQRLAVLQSRAPKRRLPSLKVGLFLGADHAQWPSFAKQSYFLEISF